MSDPYPTGNQPGEAKTPGLHSWYLSANDCRNRSICWVSLGNSTSINNLRMAISMGSPKKENPLMYFRSAVLWNSSFCKERILAILPFGTHSLRRVRYVAGVSPSSRAGYGGGPDGCLDTGVPGPTPGDPLRGRGGSEFCLNRWEKLKISPKLLRPLVEVEVLADEARYGDGCWSGSASESMVDDLSRRLDALGRGEEFELAERAEVVESLLDRVGPASPTAERAGDGRAETWSLSSDTSDLEAADCGSPVSGLGGKGKRGARFLFKRGMRNRLPSRGEFARRIPRSPRLWSERDDSEKRRSAPDERWESLGPRALRAELVESRMGSSPESAFSESLDSWVSGFRFGFIAGSSSREGSFDLAKTFNLFCRLTGSMSWLVGAVVMMVGAKGSVDVYLTTGHLRGGREGTGGTSSSPFA